MDTMKSFKGYGKVDELEEQAFRRKTRKRCIILIVSSIVLVAVIIGAVAGTLITKRNNDNDSDNNSVPSTPTSPSASLKAVCSVTQYPDSCFSSISSLEASNSTTDPEQLFQLSLKVAVNELSKLSSLPDELIAKSNDTKIKHALADCKDLFEDAVDRLNDSISSMNVDGNKDDLLTVSKINDMKTWLSSTITDQETCLDGLREFNYTLVEHVKTLMNNSTVFASNSLAIVAKIMSLLADFNTPVHRRLLGIDNSKIHTSSGFPHWVGPRDRRLLQEVNPTADVTVAKDGSGDFSTINEAVLATVTKKNTTRTVIYVKEGKYVENVILDKHKWNVMIYGDGMYKTVVSGNLSFVDGTPTFSTATFIAAGKGFIAKDIGFENTAGAIKHQAVAFRSGSDQSVFYRCSFNGFQDTLYAHSNRQFYRDCDITGTIDFIFGNAAVVLQACNIKPRQPMANQFNTITAQGKKDPNQNTGIAIHKCNISPLDNVTATTFLGRPWKDYSTTIFMESAIGSFVSPLGWTEWINGVTPPSTIFYAEYQNTGPGSTVDQRVNWPGYKPTITQDEAAKFTVGSFIQGADWLPATSVSFDASLS